MNENINLCELLKGHEKEKFYYAGTGAYYKIRDIANGVILIERNVGEPGSYLAGKECFVIHSNGGMCESGECLLFPSKEQRDWNKWAAPKTWSNLRKCNPEVWKAIAKLDYGSTEPVIKSSVAFFKIHQLIELSYGGNISFEEKIGYNSYYDIVINDYYDNSEWEFSVNQGVIGNNLICFHTKEQAEEFLSYPENVQLIKDFYMI